ncbi:MAG: glycoside hydrolase family 3 N-terminal domain-containing protein [Chitinophagaceae bacterium]
MKKILVLLAVLVQVSVSAQHTSSLGAAQWVDSIFKTLSKEQKIAQLMIVRLSTGNATKTQVVFHDKEVAEAIQKYNVGGICLFQGGPVTQANFVNYFQSIAKTPLMICIDGENGVGMRMDSVEFLPRQMMLGAMSDPALVYEYGKVVGAQCKRAGIQVNYAPVVDINNNPDNPVINDRSFGEDKYKVSSFGVNYMRGLQDAGVMACAKHFPGHGDVAVDSHLDLPVINKTKAELDSLEIYPFHEMIKAGVASVMVAHLSIPAIDNTANRPTSISYKNVTTLLRNELGFTGLTFTDALEMKGVAKYFPDGEASAQSLIAGNDMLCLPGDIPGAIDKIKNAIKKKKLSWDDIDMHVKKVLMAKYQYGLANNQPINTYHLTEDLNEQIPAVKKMVAENALTLLRNDEPFVFPLPVNTRKRIAYVGFGLTEDNAFSQRMRSDYKAHTYYFDYKLDSVQATALLQLMKNRYDVVVIGLHNYARYPANNFGISATAQSLILQLQQQFSTINFVFGNPYAIKNFCATKTLIACYEDDATVQQTAADLLNGRFVARGRLPVTVCPAFSFGAGISPVRLMAEVAPANAGLNASKLNNIDSIANDAIKKHAFPGCVVLVAKDGKIVFDKSYGYLTYDSTQPVYRETIYDMASVTKIMATLLSVMKLYDEGKLGLQNTLGDYLPWTRGTNKEKLKLWDILLHQAGLKAFIPFYRETIDTSKIDLVSGKFFSNKPDSLHGVRVADNMFMRTDWTDTIYQRILKSPVAAAGNYIYSDNDFIFLGKIVEALSGQTLDQYVKTNFYDKLGLVSTGFKPRERFPLNDIAPTENEKGFRNQLLWGDVHDPGAAMFGGVAGHAGLFSNAADIAVLCQMLLNGGTFNGQQFLKKETIDYFSQYHSANSRRGLGFDKPEKDNATSKDPYPARSASTQTIGHTGYTGTCFWIDPASNLVFVFLSNRVNPDGGTNGKISTMSVRPKVMEAIYNAIEK